MARQKIEDNIYYDERCKKYPYYVSIMRRGHNFYKKYNDIDSAREARDAFIHKHETTETNHPFVFKRNGRFVLEIAIEKTYDDFEEAEKKAELLRRFIDN